MSSEIPTTLENFLMPKGDSPGSPSHASSPAIPCTSDDLTNPSLHPLCTPLLKSPSSPLYLCRLTTPLGSGLVLNSPNTPVQPLGSDVKAFVLRQLSSLAFANDDRTAALVKTFNENRLPDSPAYAVEEIEAFRRFGHEKYALLRLGPFADLYAKLALEKHSKFEQLGDKLTPEQESDVLSSCEVLNAKLSLSYGATLLFNSQVLTLLGGREEEAKDTARCIIKADAPLWGIGVGEGALADVGGRAVGDSALFEQWYENVKDTERQQEASGAGVPGEGKGERDIAIENASEIMDRVVLGGGGWEAAREEIGDAYRKGGLDDVADRVMIK